MHISARNASVAHIVNHLQRTRCVCKGRYGLVSSMFVLMNDWHSAHREGTHLLYTHLLLVCVCKRAVRDIKTRTAAKKYNLIVYAKTVPNQNEFI